MKSFSCQYARRRQLRLVGHVHGEVQELLEISHRNILEWAEKSGIWKKQGFGVKTCNAKPGMQFQCKELDDGSVLRAMLVIAALQKRNYAIMEVRGNRIKEVRVGVLAKFPAAHFEGC